MSNILPVIIRNVEDFERYIIYDNTYFNLLLFIDSSPEHIDNNENYQRFKSFISQCNSKNRWFKDIRYLVAPCTDQDEMAKKFSTHFSESWKEEYFNEGRIIMFFGQRISKTISLQDLVTADPNSPTQMLAKQMCGGLVIVITGARLHPDDADYFSKDIPLALTKFQIDVKGYLPEAYFFPSEDNSRIEMYPMLQAPNHIWCHVLVLNDPSRATVMAELRDMLVRRILDLSTWYIALTLQDMREVAGSIQRMRTTDVGGMILLNSCNGDVWAVAHHETWICQVRFSAPIQGDVPIEGILADSGILQVSDRIRGVLEKSKHVEAFLEHFNHTATQANVSQTSNKLSDNSIYIFPAGKGDSSLLLLDKKSFLIDGGYNQDTCYGRTISKLKHLDAVVLTHVDEDHIKGFLTMFEAIAELKSFTIDKVYFNAPETAFVYTPTGRSFRQGDSLLSLINKARLKRLNAWAKPDDKIKIHENGDVFLHVVSPTHNVDNLHCEWDRNRNLIKTGQKEKSCYRSTGVMRNDGDCKVSLQNYTSVSLLAQYSIPDRNEVRFALFTGDAPKNQILEGLKNLGFSNGIDLVYLDIPHHGSKMNTDQEFFKQVRSSFYVISTNGDAHGHPDKETLLDLFNAISEWDGKLSKNTKKYEFYRHTETKELILKMRILTLLNLKRKSKMQWKRRKGWRKLKLKF
ncbi:beta-lactamase-like protein [Paraphysoderma sedebokerense]|nr:beta-lactamase-like protein [Paraphysoderma sedebokerense]